MEVFLRELSRISTNNLVNIDKFKRSLQNIGGVSGYDAQRVASIAGSEDAISKVKLTGLLEEARYEAKMTCLSI